MAESQVPFSYDAGSLAALKASLSSTRYQPYLNRAQNNEPYAFALYLYNGRIAKSLLFPLAVVEVTTRNTIDTALCGVFGNDWHSRPAFIDTTLTVESRQSLDKAIRRVGNASHNKVVAELTFDFWSNLFRPEYHDLWRTLANVAFPNLAPKEGRAELQTLMRSINSLRNRVAHHEPVIDLNINKEFSNILELIRLRCRTTADWMLHHSTVATIQRTAPTADGLTVDRFLAHSDAGFLLVNDEDKISSIYNEASRKAPGFVCIDQSGVASRAFSKQQLADFILQEAEKNEGIVDLGDLTVSQIFDQKWMQKSFYLISDKSDWSEAVKILTSRYAKIVVGCDDLGAPTGICIRAHRRY